MREVALGSVAVIERTVVDPGSLDPSTKYLGLEHIESGGRIRRVSSVGESKIASAKFLFSEDHVLFGKLRPNLAKVARPSFAGVCSTDILPIRPGNDLDRRYLAHYLLLPRTVEEARTRAAGANLPRLSASVLESFLVPLPSLEEQRHIATILDKAALNSSRRESGLRRLRAAQSALFSAIFGDPQNWENAHTARTAQIAELALAVDYGTSAKAGLSGGWPVLRMGNLTDQGELDLSDLKYLDLADAEIPKYTLKRGDLLFNRTNSLEKVGKAAVVRTDRPLAYAGYLIRVRFDSVAMAEFVAAYLNSPYGRAMRKKIAKAAVNQANINAKEMGAIPILIPPVSKLEAFAERLNVLDRQRALVQSALDLDNELFASLQHRAFSGML